MVTKELIAIWPPFTLAFVRVTAGHPGAVAVCAHPDKTPEVRLPWAGALADGPDRRGAVLPACSTPAMVHVSASQGALVRASIPAMTALVAVLWLRERAAAMRWLGIAISVGGVLIVFSGGGSDGGQSRSAGQSL